VSGVTKRFGGLVALDAVSLGVEPGSITALVGPNGSGKTTLFNIISGLLRPDAGTVAFKGREIQAQASHEIARLGIARTFQMARLFSNLTLIENVELPQHAASRTTLVDALLRTPRHGREARATRERAEQLLGELGGGRLYPRRFDYPHTCSLGEQRMLEIIRVLAMKPDVVLLDEPTQGLSPAWVEEMLALLQDIRRRGKTIVLIEHKMGLVMQVSDHVVVLSSGQTIRAGPPELVRTDPVVIRAYLGT
jgi:ABC-type branched-subunit amino acid transport system ATPase component